MKSTFSIPSATFLASVAMIAGCLTSTSTPAPSTEPSTMHVESATGVRVVAPETKLAAEVLMATGTVYSRQEATIAAQTGGVMTQLSVQVGDQVKKGQVLARLDATTASIAVAQAKAGKSAAEATLDGAQMDAERTRKLAASGSVPEAILEKSEVGLRQAKAQTDQANASLRNAEKMQRDTAITAPFDGVVATRIKNVGDLITPGTSLFTLVDTQSLEVRAQIPESIVDSLRVDDAIKGTLNATGALFEARVSSVGATVDLASRTVQVIAEVQASADGAIIRPGALVRLDFSSTPQTELASNLFLPSQAVSSDGQRGFVWVVEDGKAARRQVAVTPMLPGTVRVESGLNREVLVVADASLRLREGETLRVVQ